MVNLIPVLFVHPKSNYNKFPFFDCYDEKRNSLTYSGSKPVICHPPCRKFSRLRGLSCAPDSEKELGYWSIDLVRKNGGIVEHPHDSQLWKDKEVVKPGTIDEFGGFTFCIDQSWFGYYTPKRTILYIVGIKPKELPDYDFNRDINFRKFQNLTKKQRSETTSDLCIFLKKIIDKINLNCGGY
ncbi:hypothetical protein LXD69_14400 [Flavobacterium sediminilitoris]|uniref:Nucleotide modification associated domain-containing protein n=1 Tax=Flavobacterium sediminilitoris TaxID=2024526 RepID=A0ABY4HK33_9FLAO|nr:hypothetical protein [Flavobacterium sediminilitoris]UOX33224.1 hypothetical protein LXD69_14400 [Flavobacterium sediminilitoris]